jgi:hypothetical protein
LFLPTPPRTTSPSRRSFIFTCCVYAKSNFMNQ